MRFRRLGRDLVVIVCSAGCAAAEIREQSMLTPGVIVVQEGVAALAKATRRPGGGRAA